MTYSANSQHKTKVENELTKHLTPEGVPLTTDKRAFKYIVIAQYGRGVNVSAKEQVDKSVDPEVQAHATTIKSIIDAEAFVPKHLQIKAFELKPNAKGEWTIETPIFNDSIPNEIEQTPGSYNVSGTEREIAIKLPLGQVDLAFLKKWFNDENASAIDKAIRLNRGKITSFEILQSKTLEVLGSTDKRKIALSALENHITIP